jgi:hypothetical protein
MSAAIELQLAEQHTAELRKKAADEQRQHDTDKLASVRAELRTKRAELHKVEGNHKRQNEQRARIQSKLNQVLLEIDESWRQRPVVADIPLLHDPEVIAWKRDHKRLEDERDKLIEQRNSVPQVDLMAAVRLAKEVESLEYSEGNLLNKLTNSFGTEPTNKLFFK